MEDSVQFLGGAAFSEAGGIQTFNRTLITTLRNAGLLKSGFLTNDAQSDIPLELQNILRGGSHSKKKLLTWSIPKLAQKSDVFISDHLNYSPLVAIQFRSRLKVVVLHAYEMQIQIKSYRRRALDRIDAFICVSEYSRRLALELGLPRDKLHVCYHGLDIEVPEKQNSQSANDKVMILFVGRLDRHYKGHDHLVQAAKRLKDKGCSFQMVFAGGGSKLDDFRRMVERESVGDCVEFMGYVPDAELEKLYSKADIFALPSAGEGFGLVYLEAMAHGLPCIGCLDGASPELVADGETGLCVPYGNVDALAQALECLIASCDLREQYGENGRRRYLGEFTVSAFEKRFIHLLKELQAHTK